MEISMDRCLTKTAETTDTMDFEGFNCFVELTTRNDSYHYDQWFIKKEGWILPTWKIRRAIEEKKKGKDVVFFYFWKAGKTLWRWDFQLEDVNDIKNEYPEWHLDKQEQSYVKEEKWKRVY